ncbi:MAG: di-trans,poly-cis-decaprenylcistransferase [Clostridiales bacterium]|nr:di-trans,poly-cis-decaprenylcistransferase [Clostridiales bacterium]
MLRPFWKRPAAVPPAAVDKDKIPAHIAIIMDGNGRWAAARNLPRSAGHREGARNFRRIAGHCKDIGVKYLTVYAFSTENWKRPREEVDTIMGLFREYLQEAAEELKTHNIQIRVLGDLTIFHGELRRLIDEVQAMNHREGALIANLAVNYGGRAELVRAANAAAAQKQGPLTERDIEAQLYTAGQPEPDLIIRPSGEYRLSGFLLWQCAYSELYFTDVLWPDFTPEHLDAAIAAYQQRSRRYGGLS